MARVAKVAVCSTPNTVIGESDEERYQFNLGKAEELLHEAAAQGGGYCLPAGGIYHSRHQRRRD